MGSLILWDTQPNFSSRVIFYVNSYSLVCCGTELVDICNFCRILIAFTVASLRGGLGLGFLPEVVRVSLDINN